MKQKTDYNLGPIVLGFFLGGVAPFAYIILIIIAIMPIELTIIFIGVNALIWILPARLLNMFDKHKKTSEEEPDPWNRTFWVSFLVGLAISWVWFFILPEAA